eukprot:3302179-Pleurochrysis_carterae.AAC.2
MQRTSSRRGDGGGDRVGDAVGDQGGGVGGIDDDAAAERVAGDDGAEAVETDRSVSGDDSRVASFSVQLRAVARGTAAWGLVLKIRYVSAPLAASAVAKPERLLTAVQPALPPSLGKPLQLALAGCVGSQRAAAAWAVPTALSAASGRPQARSYPAMHATSTADAARGWSAPCFPSPSRGSFVVHSAQRAAKARTTIKRHIIRKSQGTHLCGGCILLAQRRRAAEHYKTLQEHTQHTHTITFY